MIKNNADSLYDWWVCVIGLLLHGLHQLLHAERDRLKDRSKNLNRTRFWI